MPRYEITSPDGKRFEVTAPEGASQEEVLQYAQSQFGQPAAAKELTATERAGRVLGLGARAVAKGVSAVPTLMADAASEAINAGSSALGSDYRMKRPSVALDEALSKILPTPANAVERISSDVTGAMAGVGGQIGALRKAAGAVPKILTRMPGRQIVSAGTGSGAASVVREGGGGPAAQFAAGVAGGALPFATPIARGSRPLSPSEEIAQEANQAGYTIPPTQVRPNIVNKVLEGVSGKVTTAQQASSKNQVVTNRLAAESLGLPPDTTITPPILEKIRSEAGQAYGRIKMLPLKFKTDSQFQTDIQGLGKEYASAAREFPEIAGNKSIEDLQQSLGKNLISPSAAIELVKKLRFDAAKNYKSFDDPAKAALASAQKQAANAIEGLIERRLTQSGKSDLVDQFQKARQLIAKTYDVEAALNEATGTVSARVIGNQMGKQTTGKLATVGRFSNAFPKAAQLPETMGSIPGISRLDFYAGAGLGVGGAMFGSPAVAGLALARPAIRAGILSGPFQGALAPTAPIAREQALGLGLLSNLYQP